MRSLSFFAVALVSLPLPFACGGSSGSPDVAMGDSGANGSDAPVGSSNPDASSNPDGSASASGSGGADAGSDALLPDGASDAGSTDPRLSHSNRSGTRLKAEWLVAADGAEEFVGWRDTQLKQDCRFGLAGDGLERCLPSAASHADGASFADAACTKPVAPGPGCGTAAPSDIVATDVSTCPSRTRVYASGAKAAKVYTNGGGSCVLTSSSDTYYELGAEMAPSTFVSATHSSSAPQGGIVVNYLKGADGSFGFSSFTDGTTGLECSFILSTDGRYHCLPDQDSPAASDWGGDFVNGACTSPGFAFWTQCATPTVGTATVAGASCAPAMGEVVHLGTAASSTFYSGPTPCQAEPARPDIKWLPGLAPMAPASFGGAIPRLAAGSMRLLEYDFVTTSGLVQTASVPATSIPFFPNEQAFHDSQLDVDCTMQIASDGKYRCLPTDTAKLIAGDGFYADAACTVPVLAAVDACLAIPAYGVLAETSACPAKQKIVSLIALGPSSMIYSGAPGSCTLTTNPGWTLFTAGVEIAPGTFALMAEELK
jgi:hypothetical protein